MSIVDFPLHRPVADQSVDVTRLRLSVAVDSADGLRVVAGIPPHVCHNDTVSTNQIDAKATSSEWEERERRGEVRMVMRERRKRERGRKEGRGREGSYFVERRNTQQS